MIAVDASMAVKWVAPEEHSDKAKDLYRAAIEAGERLVAPPLLPIEVVNILRQKMRGAQTSLTLREALQLVEQFMALPVELSVPDRLYQHALEMADKYGLPAAYDAHYIALAELLGCSLWTDNRRLIRALGRQLPFVRPIGDYEAGASL